MLSTDMLRQISEQDIKNKRIESWYNPNDPDYKEVLLNYKSGYSGIEPIGFAYLDVSRKRLEWNWS